MRKPDQSLNEYIARPASKVTSGPPRPVLLRRTGEVEVLEPLIRPDDRTRPARRAFKTFRSSQPLWFRRVRAVGSGVLVMIALVLGSAILVGINDPAAGPDVAVNWKLDDILRRPVELFTLDVSPPSTFEVATGGIDILGSSVRRRSARPRTNLTAYRSKRHTGPSPQPEYPKFVPTTLVIYPENGVINTRIEPWLQAVNKKPPTFDN